MTNAASHFALPKNEPVFDYGPGSNEKLRLKECIAELKSSPLDIPLIIGGEEIRTGNTVSLKSPHDHTLDLGVYHLAGKKEVDLAIEAALEARKSWSNLPWEHRVSVFMKAADLLSGPWRSTVVGATMLGQSKTVYQAEIEAAAELCDFWRFNAYHLTQLMAQQPFSPDGMWNRMEYRPLEGFVLAVSPFNFTAIGANLPSAPAVVGGVSVWKPASSAVFSNYYAMKLMEEAGLPAGVINFVPGPGSVVGAAALESPDLAGIHFTGSTAVFQNMWKTVGDNITRYKSYPRIVGETGGKDFIFAHSSADVKAMVVAAIRGAFEYQGQKCSAASRMYIPESIWPQFKNLYTEQVAGITLGDPENFSHFMAAVIDEAAFESITKYIEFAKNSDEAEILTGGSYDGSKGWFIEPTTILTKNPRFKTMQEEIFGPVLTIYIYPDEKFTETLALCDRTSPYALTGAIFARERQALAQMSDVLKNAAGNFYINDKPTAAVINQQPFGGSRASGTNDKAGIGLNIIRWISARSIKETMVPPYEWRYPFMEEA